MGYRMASILESRLTPGASIFITGGSGFLGRRIIADLVRQGFRVRALARSDAAKATVKALGADPVGGDLSDGRTLQTGMQACEAVIHAAAKVETWGRWEDFLNITVEGTERVLEAARNAGVRRLVHISTEAVLADGRPMLNVDESVPLPASPNGMYPRSKGMAEQRVLAADGAGLLTVIVRPRFIWGLGDTTLLPSLVEAMRSGKWVWFGKDHLMSTCHVANVSHGTILAAKYGGGRQVYFLTDGSPVPFRDFISRLVETQGVQPPKISAPLWSADVAAAAAEAAWRLCRLSGAPPLTRTLVNLFFREVTVNDGKARRDLGYDAVMAVADGLRELRERAERGA